MAYDKVVDSTELDAGLSAVADAIRDKTGETESLVFPGGFVTAILGIATGGSSDSAVSGEVHNITIETDLQTAGQIILHQNQFVAANYRKTGFMVLLFPKEPSAVSTNNVLSLMQGNLNLGASGGYFQYGYVTRGTGFNVSTAAISKTIIDEMDGSTSRFNTDDMGTLSVYAARGNNLQAGDYKLVLLCFDI